MAVPDFQSLMRPVLRALAGGDAQSTQATLDAIVSELQLSPADVAQPMPSGRAPLLTNRVAWAKFHLKRAGLIESPERGLYRITVRGIAALDEGPERLTMSYLKRFPEYAILRTSGSDVTDDLTEESDADVELTPEEYLERGHARLRSALSEQLLERIGQMSASFFEKLVVQLLVAMGYGGTQADAGQAVGPGSDGGIDGVIKEDRLGLETIYIQSKRWKETVGRPEIQRFAGALQGQRARKGVFITTSAFTKEAKSYAATIQTTIVLIDGPELADLMIDHNVGVTHERSYEVKRIDSDYFTPE